MQRIEIYNFRLQVSSFNIKSRINLHRGQKNFSKNSFLHNFLLILVTKTGKKLVKNLLRLTNGMILITRIKYTRCYYVLSQQDEKSFQINKKSLITSNGKKN